MTLYSKVFKAIKDKCLDCSGFSSNNVNRCPAYDCPLHPYRFGQEPEMFPEKKSTPDCEKSKSVQ